MGKANKVDAKACKEEHHIPIFFDVDMTLTEEYQEIPLFRGSLAKIKRLFLRLAKEYPSADLKFSGPLDYFKISRMYDDRIGLRYMQSILFDTRKGGPFEGLTNKALFDSGRKVKAAPGMYSGLKGLKEECAAKGIILHYFLVSVGIKQLVEGFVEAHGLKDTIDGVYASGFLVNKRDEVIGIKRVVTPFTKNEHVISTIKGNASMLDAYMKPSEYRFRYKDVIVVGDGLSDISKFSYAKKNGGTAVAVYKRGSMKEFLDAKDNLSSRADYILPRDYTQGSTTYRHLKAIIMSKCSAECDFDINLLYNYKSGGVRNKTLLKVVRAHLKSCRECREFFKKTFVAPR